MIPGQKCAVVCVELKLAVRYPLSVTFNFTHIYLYTFYILSKKHSLQALQKLDARLFCLSLQLAGDIRYCYIMLYMNVLNLTMLCGKF